jgi:hypothetical protein
MSFLLLILFLNGTRIRLILLDVDNNMRLFVNFGEQFGILFSAGKS